jgi:hypothetical protein
VIKANIDTVFVLIAFLATLVVFGINESDQLKDLLYILGGAVAGVAGTSRKTL